MILFNSKSWAVDFKKDKIMLFKFKNEDKNLIH